MVRFLLYSLIFMGALVIVAEASNMASPAPANYLQPPASSPSKSNNNAIKNQTAKAHLIRKHHNTDRTPAASPSPSLSPSEAPVTKENTDSLEKQSSLHQEARAPGQPEDLHLTNPRRHHAFDKSVAGGGVILGGLGTTFLIAVICYIRATRRTTAAKEATAPAVADQV